MAIINTSKNKPNEPITTGKPNLTITNLKGIVQNFSGDNLRLQGLEKRNFTPSSITGNMPGSNVKHFPDRTHKPKGSPLAWFQGSYHYIGPVYVDQSKGESLLLEMSAGFKMPSPDLRWSASHNEPKYWHEIEFSLGYADNPNGNGVQTIRYTKRKYRSAIFEGLTEAYRHIAGSCTIVTRFVENVSGPIFFYMQVADTHYAQIVNLLGDESKIQNLNIYSSRMQVRKYKK